MKHKYIRLNPKSGYYNFIITVSQKTKLLNFNEKLLNTLPFLVNLWTDATSNLNPSQNLWIAWTIDYYSFFVTTIPLPQFYDRKRGVANRTLRPQRAEEPILGKR